jgi:hypothetical protein
MHRILVVAACTMFFAAGPADSQDIEKALKSFNLVGTWSPDCSDKAQPRWTFAGGEKPAVAFTSPGKEPANDESAEGSITAAEIVSPTKISVTVVPTKKNGKSIDPASPDAKPETGLLEKVGNMIKPPSGPMLQRCVN